MDLNKKITWDVTKNTVNDRMLESSLVHRFSRSNKYNKSTKLLNNWLKDHTKVSYTDYIRMKRLIKKCVSNDVLIEDSDNYEDEDYLMEYRMVLNQNKIKNNQNEISDNHHNIYTSTPIKTVQEEKDISFSDSDLSQTSTKNTSSELSILQDKDYEIIIKSFSDIQNVDTVPTAEIKQSVYSPKQYFTQTNKTQFVDTEKNRCENTTEIGPTNAKKRKKSEKASLSHNSSFMNGKRTSKEILDLIPNEEDIIVLDSNTSLDNINSFSDIQNVDTVPTAEIKQSVCSPKQYFTQTNKTQFVDTEENRCENTTEIGPTNAKKRKKSEKASLSYNSSFMNGKRTSKEILDLIPNEEDIIVLDSNTSLDNINSFAVQKHKSQAKILSNEIINNKYKIINMEESCSNLQNKYDDSIELLENNDSLKFLGYEEEKEDELEKSVISIENTSSSNFLSLYDKRLNQIKNLNLTEDSSSISNNSNGIIKKNITRCSKNFDLTISNTSSEDELLKEQDSNEEMDNLNSIATIEKIRKKLILNKSPNADYRTYQNIPYVQSKINNINHSNSIDHCSNDSNNSEQVETFHRIPCNLEDLIEIEELVHDTTKSSFTLEDLSQDNEIFLLNIPSTIQLTSLKDQRFVLKKDKLKLGKNRYKISYKDVPSQSCVLATHKNSKSYKLVNIKPTSSILVREKLPKKNKKTVNVT